jgi:hypothetical protein
MAGMLLRAAVVVTALSFPLLGCVAEKGGEENPLVDGKADSFYSPTPHGQLVFGAPNKATITAAEKFHAWTFTLRGDAKLSIKTEVSTNLDTVMYLYRRDLGSSGMYGSFGSYILKNDDHEGEIWSQLDFDGEEGEYRVIVKAFKSAQAGPFSVAGSCDGAGCPAVGACFSDPFDPLPAESSMWNASCANDLLDGFTTRSTSANAVSVAETAVCTLDALGKRSVDLYRAYWDQVQGWEDFKDGEFDIQLEVETVKHGAFTEVHVDAPYDEDAMTFTYGAAGELLSLYQSNQSPDARTFCDGTGTIAAPDQTCIELMRDALRHAGAETTGTKTTTCATAANGALPPLVDAPICEFTSKYSLADTASVTVDYRTWQSDGGLLGAEVKMTSGSTSMTYVLGTTFRDTTEVFATKAGSTMSLSCYEL